MKQFGQAWAALLAAVAQTADEDFEQPSGCVGWSVRDLVCHLVIDAQDVLITLVTPADGPATVDATGYWKLVEPPTGEDPLDALIPRLAAAYGEPRWLKFHLDDVGSAAGRAAARVALERIAGSAFPAVFSDQDALLIGTGRRQATADERAALAGFGARLPLVLG
ncbi:maleylpyruvate isomerase N-terminal domain-containing protein [Kribbella monticola]|uniref:maleylpyruvate isomerase N-terminal domain-containing protein n=1 Tax=Kribbella monticola TaxID=2185285 RepID=UPI000DD34059|nr:maleylpyruvate isomerase N-terminal domain-containing protein [Kribbella monticola]